MPPKGFVGIHLTAQRKLMLAELMKQEDFAKATNAIDFAVALAQEYVNTDAEEVGESGLPDFINYYVGEVAPFSDTAQNGALVQRRADIDVRAVGSVTWRMDGLNTIRNYEPTITNLADAVDFALMTALVHSRAGTVTVEHKNELKSAVARNAVQFKEILTEFRSNNMNDKRATNPANDYAEKEDKRKVKSSKKPVKERDAVQERVQSLLFYAYQKFNKCTVDGDVAGAAAAQSEIDRLIGEVHRAERKMRMDSIVDMSNKAKNKFGAGTKEAKNHNQVDAHDNPIDF